VSDTRRVIVFESVPYWGPELERQFLSEPVAVRACRSLRDLDALVGQEPLAGVLLDLAADVGGCLRWLGRRQQQSPSLPVTVVAPAEHLRLEWYVRELGALAFVSEFIGGRRMAAVCRKQWRPVSQ
jgi:hypothetical protein